MFKIAKKLDFVVKKAYVIQCIVILQLYMFMDRALSDPWSCEIMTTRSLTGIW